MKEKSTAISSINEASRLFLVLAILILGNYFSTDAEARFWKDKKKVTYSSEKTKECVKPEQYLILGDSEGKISVADMVEFSGGHKQKFVELAKQTEYLFALKEAEYGLCVLFVEGALKQDEYQKGMKNLQNLRICYVQKSVKGDCNNVLDESKASIKIVLVDGRQVYNEDTGKLGGTNTTDLKSVVESAFYGKDFDPILSFYTFQNWDGGETIKRINPDLVIMHWSAFDDNTRSADESHQMMGEFLRRMAASDTNFLLYSRSQSFLDSADGTHVRRLKGILTWLGGESAKSRVSLLQVPWPHEGVFPNGATTLDFQNKARALVK